MAGGAHRGWTHCLLIAAWLCAAPALADENEWRALTAAIETLQAEQQALYQQFQMLQSLQLNEQRLAYESVGPQTGPPRSYEDVVREREEAQARATAYQAELDELYERYRELEREKQPLLERLRALSLSPSAP